MFAPRYDDMERLPSFEELMMSLLDHRSAKGPTNLDSQCNSASRNARQAQKHIYEVASVRNDYGPAASLLQLPHQLSKVSSSRVREIPVQIQLRPPEPVPNATFPSTSFVSSTFTNTRPLFTEQEASRSQGSPHLTLLPKEGSESSSSSQGGSRRSHNCKSCGRSFTTSGHLARHNRIHTGERNHKCPFPRCSARFARQDNCTQHYRTHLNGKTKKNRGKNSS